MNQNFGNVYDLCKHFLRNLNVSDPRDIPNTYNTFKTNQELVHQVDFERRDAVLQVSVQQLPEIQINI